MMNLTQPLRILLVDDSPEFLESAVSFLSANSDLRVVGRALSGEHALEQVKELQPDLVITDLSMPGLDGIETTRRLKMQDGSPRVIILSLDDDSEYRAAAKSAQADGLITKSEFGTDLLPMIEMLFSQVGSAEIKQAAE